MTEERAGAPDWDDTSTIICDTTSVKRWYAAFTATQHRFGQRGHAIGFLWVQMGGQAESMD